MKLCECGCGEPAPIASRTRRDLGHVRGKPIRFRLGHNTPKGEESRLWRGGRYLHSGGYIVVSGTDGPELEHRIVMSEMVGRPLLPGEQVHHVNETKDDNRPENLWLFPSEASHRGWHMLQQADGVLKKPMKGVPLRRAA